VNSVIKLNKTNAVDLNDFSNLHYLYFSEGHILMLAKSFEKKKGKNPQGGKLEAITVIV
jgi:hypothetical protein